MYLPLKSVFDNRSLNSGYDETKTVKDSISTLAKLCAFYAVLNVVTLVGLGLLIVSTMQALKNTDNKIEDMLSRVNSADEEFIQRLQKLNKTLISLKGDAGIGGPAGPIGDRGTAGPDGQMGPTGPAGEKGGRGEDGQTVSTGQTGERGEMGPGQIGPTKGQTGEPGSTGPDGTIK